MKEVKEKNNGLKTVIQEQDTFEIIVDALDGDYLAAYSLCTALSGMSIRIPSKMHKMKFAELMYLLSYNKKEILSSTGISRASYYNIIKKRRARIQNER